MPILKRDIDLSISESLFKREVVEDSEWGHGTWINNEFNPTPNYAGNIKDAWTIVDHLYDSYRFDTEIQLYEDAYLGKRYRCVIAEIDHQENAYTVFAETAPLAICLAALKLSGVDVTEYEHE